MNTPQKIWFSFAFFPFYRKNVQILKLQKSCEFRSTVYLQYNDEI